MVPAGWILTILIMQGKVPDHTEFKLEIEIGKLCLGELGLWIELVVNLVDSGWLGWFRVSSGRLGLGGGLVLHFQHSPSSRYCEDWAAGLCRTCPKKDNTPSQVPSKRFWVQNVLIKVLNRFSQISGVKNFKKHLQSDHHRRKVR